MSTMGLAVYCNGCADPGEREQLLLLRTLQDNERTIIGGTRVNAVTKIVGVPEQQQQQQQPPHPPHQQQQQQRDETPRRAETTTTTTTTVLPPYDPSRLKKHGRNGQPPPIAVAKRNARERNRVKQVNNGFATLRQHIPSHVAQGYGDRGKKLSKVETLRMAVEYIRGLQRLLAEADGLEYEASRNPMSSGGESSIMIPSPSGSVYSGSTHNGSGGDVLCLAGSELDETQPGESTALDIEDMEAETYLVEEDEEDNDKERREAKRFRDDGTSQNRLSENKNRDRTLVSSMSRRRRNSSTGYYVTRQCSSFGDEENIEPLSNRNINNLNNIINNNNNNNNNNNLLSGFSPILIQSSSPSSNSLPPIKREICLLDDEETRRSNEDDIASGSLLTSSSPYTGEILIENPETGRLVPLKLESHDEASAGAQLVYVATEGLPGGAYYKHELSSEGGGEFMDVVSWWEQEQGRLTHQLQTHHHHHHVGQHQQTHHQTHQQLTAQQRLAHV